MYLHSVKEKSLDLIKLGFGEKLVYFIRHGQSIANLVDDSEKSNMTHLRDAQLTDLGKQQAIDLQPIVKDWNVQVVLVSPMTRTLQTAYYLN